MSGSGVPDFAATMISRTSLLVIWARRFAVTSFLLCSHWRPMRRLDLGGRNGQDGGARPGWQEGARALRAGALRNGQTTCKRDTIGLRECLVARSWLAFAPLSHSSIQGVSA